MLKDLSAVEIKAHEIYAQVVVVGAGIAGLIFARKLAQSGLKIVVLESGNETSNHAPHPLNRVEFERCTHRGAMEGRYRGLGGTSSYWGGAMLPFLPCDFSDHTAGWGGKWPISNDDVEPYFAEIENIFGLPRGEYEVQASKAFVPATNFSIRSAKWPKFSKRNLAKVFRRELQAADGPEIWLNATVDRFELLPCSRLAAISAISSSGARLHVRADSFVIAAGAIESTRLLLLLDRQYNDNIFNPAGLLGCGLHDHLSMPAAMIQPRNREALNTVFGMRFVRGGMRDVRIEATESFRRGDYKPAAFAHIAQYHDEASGFAIMRRLYRTQQLGQRVHPQQLVSMIAKAPWITRAAWWRYSKGLLLFSDNSELILQLTMEQYPCVENKISLSSNRLDLFGLPQARISWAPNEYDVEAFTSMRLALLEWWSRSGLERLGNLTPIEEPVWRDAMRQGADIFHPGGTIAMGTTPANGVIDGHLCAFAIRNLYVVSSAAFPSSGTANPTFLLMALALRLSERIAAQAGVSISAHKLA